jgi:hypothetical protein
LRGGPERDLLDSNFVECRTNPTSASVNTGTGGNKDRSTSGNSPPATEKNGRYESKMALSKLAFSLYCSKEKEERNKVVEYQLMLIDNAYLDFVTSINSERVKGKLGSQIGKLLLSAAGVRTGSENTRKNLAAAVGLVEGTDTAFDGTAMYQQTITALISAMDAQRAEIRLLIYKSMDLDLSMYPASAANQDLREYLRAGTLHGGLMRIQALARDDKENEEDKIETEIRQIEPLPAASRKIRRCATEALSEKNGNRSAGRVKQASKKLMPSLDVSGMAGNAVIEAVQNFIRATGSGDDKRYSLIDNTFRDSGLYPADSACITKE